MGRHRRHHRGVALWAQRGDNREGALRLGRYLGQRCQILHPGVHRVKFSVIRNEDYYNGGEVCPEENKEDCKRCFFIWSGSGTVSGKKFTSRDIIALPIEPPTVTQSANADLSGLTGSTSTNGSTFSGTLNIGTFTAATTSYTASVASNVTHVKLTPTKAHTAASIKVGKTGSLSSVTSTQSSGAIALGAAGTSTDIKVVVTAENGTTKEYTVMVARAAGTTTTTKTPTGGTPTGGTPTGGTPTGGTPTGGTPTGGTPTGGGGPSPGEPSDLAPPSDTPTPCGENDREDLESFYEASGGVDWHEDENWNSEEPLGEWHGVGTEDGSVVSLRLSDNNLSGDMPAEELLCLKEQLVELALWGNELSGEVPEKLVLAVERAVLRDIAEMLNLNPQWFEDYEEPFEFEYWHEGVMTDDEGRVTELDFTGEDITGEIPESVYQLSELEMISTGCGVTLEAPAPEGVSVIMPDDCAEETADSGGGGCALGSGDPSVFGLFLVTLLAFAVLGRARARG